MANKIYIFNATIINEGIAFKGSVLIEGKIIRKVFKKDEVVEPELLKGAEFLDAKDKILIPGVIDDQVHFREPGLTHKGEIYTESKAAVAGGTTSYMEMPNTLPGTLTQELLEDKYNLAEQKSLANYSFYMGTSNNNVEEVLKTNLRNVCGIKVFLGASTGNMLVDNMETLHSLFSQTKALISVHSEDEGIIRKNMELFKDKYGDNIPVKKHPLIRSREACLKTSIFAVELAKKYNSRLHILHLSTKEEIELFDNTVPLSQKRITGEVCIHHLWFNDTFYESKGNLIKWNPAIKTEDDRIALFKALLEDKIDVVATDHAPHTWEEKQNTYFKAPSGGPLVQHSLVAMLEFYHLGKISLEKIVEKMCHAPAICFKVENRGFIREGYFADLVLLDLDAPWNVNSSNIHYKCGWSPFEGNTFRSKITHTFVNGNPVFANGLFNEQYRGERLLFNA